MCSLITGQLMQAQSKPINATTSSSFGEVVRSVDSVSPVIVLEDNRKEAMLAVSPSMQGRVLTSTADGRNGRSFGWVNEKLILSRQLQQHINAFGGEDRLWLGPEGGQFSIFFAPHAPFDLAHWYTPAALDTEPFEIVRQSHTSVAFRRRFTLLNYSGTQFHVQIDREVSILSSDAVWRDLKLSPVEGLKIVGFESNNKLTNVGTAPWKQETGLLSLWILGQFQATPETTIVIPIHKGAAMKLGPQVDADYFGPIPANRLAVQPGTIYFKADAAYRSKLGVNHARATGMLGSYDAMHHVLTLIQYSLPKSNAEYVNSKWEIQGHPYEGDVANAYNDGHPPLGGPQLGNFYELESSSPAAALAPETSIEHRQRTIHVEGDEAKLDKVARATLGVGLKQICSALPGEAVGNDQASRAR